MSEHTFQIPTDSSESETKEEVDCSEEFEIDSEDLDAYEPDEHDAAQVTKINFF